MLSNFKEENLKAYYVDCHISSHDALNIDLNITRGICDVAGSIGFLDRLRRRTIMDLPSSELW